MKRRHSERNPENSRNGSEESYEGILSDTYEMLGDKSSSNGTRKVFLASQKGNSHLKKRDSKKTLVQQLMEVTGPKIASTVAKTGSKSKRIGKASSKITVRSEVLPRKRRVRQRDEESVQMNSAGQKSSEKGGSCAPDQSELSQAEGSTPSMLKDNKMRDMILKLLKDGKRLKADQALRQLQHAVLGTGLQCKRCFKFIEAKSKYRYEHEQQCKSGEQAHRISFVKTQNRYFCYYGCQFFGTRKLLVQHLLEEHRSTLQHWGIKPEALEKQNPYLGSGRASSNSCRDVDPTSQVNSAASRYSQISDSDQELQDPKAEVDDPLVMFIMGQATQVQASPAAKAAEQPRIRRIKKSIAIVYSHDFLRRNILISWRIVSSHSRERTFVKKLPHMKVTPSHFVNAIGESIVVTRRVDALTPKMLCMVAGYSQVTLCFQRALIELVQLHDREQVFQGAVSLNTIALSNDGQVHFLDWSQATLLSSPNARALSLRKSYWRQEDLSSPADLPTLDILALLFSIADFVAYNHGQQPYRHILQQFRDSSRDLSFKLDQYGSQLFNYTGYYELNRLLEKYSIPRDVDYHELVEEVTMLFASDMGTGSCPCKRWPEHYPHCKEREIFEQNAQTGLRVEEDKLSHSDDSE